MKKKAIEQEPDDGPMPVEAFEPDFDACGVAIMAIVRALESLPQRDRARILNAAAVFFDVGFADGVEPERGPTGQHR